MLTAKELTDTLINKAKHMQEFVVNVDENNMILHGSIPFDITHKHGEPYHVHVHALTQEEAEQKVKNWLDNIEDPV